MTGDPLPSWRNGAAKTEILDFLARVTADGGPDFVPPAERIATFDNDGTLWCEHPMQVQVAFLIDRVKAMAADDARLAGQQPFKALLEPDLPTLHALGKQGLMSLFEATHSGMTIAAFARIARDWLASARHPTLARRYLDNTYRPQLELLALLRTRGFKTFIVSGGGVEFIRAFAEAAYGVPPEQVIGSSSRMRFDVDDQGADLFKLPELASFDDRDEKAVNIGLHIGRRPLLAFGNSDGDLAMLRYTKAGPGARLALLLHHDDAAREAAYDRDFHLSPLADALDHADRYGIRVVSMQRDWDAVFSPAAERPAA